jgi:dihydrofolate synthase/folylpolyglutamate synthase
MPHRLRSFKLARMERLLALLGDPQLRYPAVHIAGTKGKGSTAVMIDAMLRAAGYHTGLFTSPHLERIEERFVVSGAPCSESTFVDLMQRLRPAVETCEQASSELPDGDGAPTYFEITTALAMLLFAEQHVDIAVLEVGLGGRLDSTNVCRPAVTVITSISFDHTQQLGNTLAEIAREKAGIIKPGVPVVSGVTDDEPARVIRAVASDNGAELIEIQRDFGCNYQSSTPGSAARPRPLDYWHRSQPQRHGLQLALCGQHQTANAAVALATIDVLNDRAWQIDDDAIRAGLASATCAARIEVVAREPTIVLDAAHNVASVQALVAALVNDFSILQVDSQRTLIFATSRDKDARGMLALLLPMFDRVLLTRYRNNPRWADPAELAAIAHELQAESPANRNRNHTCSVEVLPDSHTALAVARAASDASDVICIAGSFFLAAELRPSLRG